MAHESNLIPNLMPRIHDTFRMVRVLAIVVFQIETHQALVIKCSRSNEATIHFSVLYSKASKVDMTEGLVGSSRDVRYLCLFRYQHESKV